MGNTDFKYFIILGMIFFNIISFLFIFKKKTTKYLRLECGRNNKRAAIISFCLLFCIFATFDGDWYHYKDYVEKYFTIYKNNTHIEPLYGFIIEHLTFSSYFLFRLVVWGGGLFILKKALKRMYIDDNTGWFIFMLFSLLHFSYVRVSLGLSILFYGYTFVVKPVLNKRTRSVFLGFVIMLLSVFFHKSMFVPIILAFVSFIPFTKIEFIISIIIYPFVCKYAQDYIVEFMFSGDEQIAGANYLLKEKNNTGIGLNILNHSTTIYVALYFIYTSIHYLFKKNNSYNTLFLRIFHWCYALVYIFFVVSTFTVGGQYLAGRFLQMIYIPFTFLLYYSIFYKKMPDYILNIILFLGWFVFNYRMIYSFYLQNL